MIQNLNESLRPHCFLRPFPQLLCKVPPLTINTNIASLYHGLKIGARELCREVLWRQGEELCPAALVSLDQEAYSAHQEQHWSRWKNRYPRHLNITHQAPSDHKVKQSYKMKVDDSLRVDDTRVQRSGPNAPVLVSLIECFGVQDICKLALAVFDPWVVLWIPHIDIVKIDSTRRRFWVIRRGDVDDSHWTRR